MKRFTFYLRPRGWPHGVTMTGCGSFWARTGLFHNNGQHLRSKKMDYKSGCQALLPLITQGACGRDDAIQLHSSLILFSVPMKSSCIETVCFPGLVPRTLILPDLPGSAKTISSSVICPIEYYYHCCLHHYSRITQIRFLPD